MPLLAEYDSQPETHDHDLFDFGLSPSPFVSSILSGAHPDPMQYAAADRVPENLPSSSSSSRDETPHFFSPNRQHQDTSLFEARSGVTASSALAATSAFPPQSLSGQQQQQQQPCQCLAAVVFALERFEASSDAGSRADLGPIVAHQKEAIRSCRSMLGCGACMAGRENLVLLVFMAERIVAACGRVVVLYRVAEGGGGGGDSNHSNRHGRAMGGDGGGGGFSAPPLPPLLDFSSPAHHHGLARVPRRANPGDLASPASSASPGSDLTCSGSVVSARTGTSAGTGTSSDWQKRLLSDYEISSPAEWEHLVRVLVFLQLRAFMDLLVDMKSMGSAILGEAQMARLVQAEIKVGDLERDVYIV